ncbi:MAG: hypothetical protein GY870_12550 [archaeon]|nr:hypothetical protein [archaeon]
MSRTYTKGRYNRNLWKVRKGFARRSCPHGHCWCRYDFGRKDRIKIEKDNYMKFHVLPFINEHLDK